MPQPPAWHPRAKKRMMPSVPPLLAQLLRDGDRVEKHGRGWRFAKSHGHVDAAPVTNALALDLLVPRPDGALLLSAKGRAIATLQAPLAPAKSA